MLELQLPALLTVIATASIDSINPCAIGVLILLISIIVNAGFGTGRLLKLGGIFIASVFLSYFLAGLGLLYAFHSIPLLVAEYLTMIVAFVVVIAGILEIKDYFWYGRWFSLAIPVKLSERIKGYAQHSTVAGVAFLGFFVSAVELPCTGAPYLAIITILSQNFDLYAFLLLVLYNFIFVLPLIIILLMVAGGKKLVTIQTWKQDNRGYMRLAAGVLLIALGWLLILMANGTINFG